DKRPGTYRKDRRPRTGRGPKRGQCLRRVGVWALLGFRSGYGYQVGAFESVETVLGDHLGADRSPQRTARNRPAHPEVELGNAVGFAIQAEHLADDAELENSEVLQGEHCDGSEHGSILSQCVSPATSGGMLFGEDLLP